MGVWGNDERECNQLGTINQQEKGMAKELYGECVAIQLYALVQEADVPLHSPLAWQRRFLEPARE